MICIFVFFSFFLNFIGIAGLKGGSYIFADTAIYSSIVASFAKNLPSILSYKNNFLFWNPNYLSVGLPTLSIVDLGALYPPTLLTAFFTMLSGNILNVFSIFALSVFAHLVFGSFFVFKILVDIFKLDKYAALFGALLWVFIGFNLEFVSASAIVFSGSYLPACFYFKLRSKPNDFFYYHILVGFAFLGGYPIVAATVYAFCTFYEFYIKRNSILETIKKEALGFFAITLPIISPQYFSTIMNFPLNIRSTINLDGFLSNAASLQTLVEAFIPRNNVFNTYSSTNLAFIYFSLVALVVFFQSSNKTQILSDKKNLFLLLTGLGGLLLSIGGITILPILGYYLVPAFSFFRRLSVFVILPQFVFCLLIPQFFTSAFKNYHLTKSSEFVVKLMAILFVIPVSLFLMGLSGKGGMDALYTSLSISGVTLMLAYFAFYINNKYSRLAVFILFFALFIEASGLILSKFYLNSKVNPREIFSPNRLIKQLQTLIKPTERVELLATQYNYATDYLDLEQTSGYLSLASMYGVQINEALTSGEPQNNLRDLLGVKYVLKKDTSDKSFKKIKSIKQGEPVPDYYVFDYSTLKWVAEASDTQFNVYKRDNTLGRIFIASSVNPIFQDLKVLKAINGLSLPTDVLVGPKNYKGADLATNGQVNLLEYTKNYLKAKVVVTKPAFVANSTGFYPGWWAKVNGKWVKPIQTNWFMMGVYVPEGVSVVEFVYFPYGFILGVFYLASASVFWWLKAKYATKK